ncbi:MAG: tetratricopeptide repeat protein [Sphingobacteriia bacterium]|nr:tetratricopeptide repeat protein [Sphingobacteriia bacterium]
MKKLFLFIFLFSILGTASAQRNDKAFLEAKDYYDKGMELAYAGKYEEAVKLLDKSLEFVQDEFVAWYNRGIIKGYLGLDEEALPDFEETLKLVPDYKKGYLNRGTTKKHLTDYDGAISDYNYAIVLDPDYSEAYYNRGLVYEMLGKKDSACADFKKSKELGLKEAKEKVEKCNHPEETSRPVNVILRLTKTAADDKYGFTKENPVKVGIGLSGGPANQKAYLNLLRDAQGKKISYTRLGSCCMYQTPNGFDGFGMLDIYEITYLNEAGEAKKADVYITFYDYEEPLILYGFKTVGKK